MTVDPTSRAERGEGFKFDSEYVLETAKNLGGLDFELEHARDQLAGTGGVDLFPGRELGKLVNLDIGMSMWRNDNPYPEVMETAMQLLRRFSDANSSTADTLRTIGEKYYQQDKAAWLKWRKLGHSVEQLREGEDKGPVV